MKAKLTWLRLHTDRSVKLAIFGFVVAAWVAAPLLSWLPDANPFRDLGLVLGGFAGVGVGLAIGIRGITGPWTRADLPRVDVVAGVIHLTQKAKRVEVPLDELGAITLAMESKRIIEYSRHKYMHYRVVAANLDEPIAESTKDGRMVKRFVALRTFVLASKVRRALQAPVEDGAFRGSDPIARATAALASDHDVELKALALLAEHDSDATVRSRAGELLVTTRSARVASGMERPGAA